MMKKIEFPQYKLNIPKNLPFIHLPGDPNRTQRRQMEREERREKREDIDTKPGMILPSTAGIWRDI